MGAWAFKVQAGPTVSPGIPDIIGCYRGLFFGLETKVPGAPGATPIQQHVHGEIRGASGHCFVVRSVAEAADVIVMLDTFATTRGLPAKAPEIAADAPTSSSRVITSAHDMGSSQAISGPRRSVARGWDS